MSRSVFNHRRRGGVYREEVLRDGPIVYWRFTELTGTTIHDETGHGHTGTLHPGAGTITLGQPSALSSEPSDPSVTLTKGFAETDQYITSTASTAYDTTSMTIEAWVHPTSGQTTKHGVASVWSTDGRWYIRIQPSTGNIEIYHSGTTTLVGGANVAFNVWTHLVVTFDTADSKYRIYFNGTLAATSSVTSMGSNTNGRFVVGHNNGITAGSEELDGGIDEVAYYGTTLSATRIAAHYAAAF